MPLKRLVEEDYIVLCISPGRAAPFLAHALRYPAILPGRPYRTFQPCRGTSSAPLRVFVVDFGYRPSVVHELAARQCARKCRLRGAVPDSAIDVGVSERFHAEERVNVAVVSVSTVRCHAQQSCSCRRLFIPRSAGRPRCYRRRNVFSPNDLPYHFEA